MSTQDSPKTSTAKPARTDMQNLALAVTVGATALAIAIFGHGVLVVIAHMQ
ncbi:hypothetical protein [Streptomyces sp. NPDC050428]|uniref:hypothetical protein n=1 Tax=Streptomyces sp. NPDC050428 TaxID=3155757 RepID=UPI00341D9316